MGEYKVTIHVDADSATEVEKLLDKTTWVDSYDEIDEVLDEIPDNDDDDDE